MLTAIVLSMLALAPIGLLARYAPRPLIGWVLALLPLAAFVGFAVRAPMVLAGGVLIETLPWVPEMGLNLRFSLDGLSLLFALLVSGIGTLIFIYTAYYLADDPGMGHFYVYLAIFMGSMLGVVLADNVLLLFIFWELTSVSSYLLVGYKHDYADARRGAQMGLLLTVGGGLALLVGLVLLSNAAGSFEISEILGAGEELRASPFYTPALLLIFLGCFTKSAQFPFHIWLPNAMQAPTPASAYLHSATMVKAGVYLLARLHPALSETPLWTYTLTVVGATTMLVGAAVALRKDDIKGLLAYSTVSLLGTMVLMAGIGGHDAPVALVTLILAHALYKGALFMLAGAVDHEAGTRKLSELGGLSREMPRTLVLTSLAALSAAGIPPLFGFVAKEELLHAVTHSELAPGAAMAAVGAVVVAAVLGILYSWRLVSGVFFGPAAPRKKDHVHEAPLGMLVAPGVLALLSVGLPLGLLPMTSALLEPAVMAITGHAEEVSLHLMPSALSLPVVLSLFAIGSGAALTRFVRQIGAAPSPLPPWLNGDRIYDAAINGLLSGTTAFTRAVQNGRLRNYILYSLLALLAVILTPLALFALGSAPAPDLSNITLPEIVTALLIPFAVLATIRARSRLGAILVAGVVGAMVSFMFVIYSGPDLALTQLLVEVITTVFFLLVFAILPASFERLSKPATRARDGVVALAIGATMAAFTWIASSTTVFPPISAVFKAEALAEGKGENVVNVILVDFRGFDTMGEITVLFIALMGIYAMLRLRPESDPAIADMRGKTTPDAVALGRRGRREMGVGSRDGHDNGQDAVGEPATTANRSQDAREEI